MCLEFANSSQERTRSCKSDRVATQQQAGPGRPQRHGRLPVFEHAVQLYRLIGALYQRPRFGDRPRTLRTEDFTWGASVDEDRRSPTRGLPMVCLICPDGPADLLNRIDQLLDEARHTGGGLRHIRLDLAGKSKPSVIRPVEAATPDADGSGWTRADVLRVRELLRQARNGLVKSPKTRGSLLRFPRFSLVHQLMGEPSDPNDPSPDGTSARMLRERSAMRRIGHAVRTVDKELPESASRWRIPLWLVYLLTLGVFRVAVTGRVPLISGRYRWFMRQPHLAPELSGSFVRFAERLVEWPQEAPEFVARLLVNAFLEDLRLAYRLRPWQLFRRRRMTYPILLLDDITADNGGYLLLRLVNDVRNQVGVFDPLLLIATSAEVPPEALSADEEGPATEAGDAYVAWQNALREERLAREKSTWYLTIGIPDPAAAPKTAAQKLRSFGGFDAGRKAGRPALIASRWLRIPVVAAVLATAIAAILVTRHDRCGSWHSSLSWTGSECIGSTDGSFDLFQPSDSATKSVVSTIQQQNQEAARLHAASPQRPYITIADLQATTSANRTADGLTAEREALEGVAVAQRRQLNKSGNSDPIVRVLIANGGQNMLQGATVARQLGSLAAQDPGRLVGVVGLDNSSKQTIDAIDALADAGLPVVSAPLSEDHLTTDHPLYFQVAPKNSTEVAVASAFASRLVGAAVPRSVQIYYSDDASDTYSTNLRDDAVRAFTSRGFQVQATAFTPSGPPVQHSVHASRDDQLIGNANSAGRDTCEYKGIAFFAGRGVPDYGDFIDSAAQCRSEAVFLGDDDVSRYVADAATRENTRALSYYYLSFAFAPPVNALQGPQLDFYHTLNQLFPFENRPSTNRSLDGHAALSYDAANVLITAVSYLRSGNQNIPITPTAVWREITDIHGSQAQHRLIDGVSGTIDYGGDIARQVPLHKPVAILQVRHGEVNPNIVGLCGTAAGFTPSAWCPSMS
jgi:hypothetical protein